MGERRIGLHETIGADFVVPGGLVVAVLLGVVTGVKAVCEREILTDDKREVGVILDVLVLDLVIRQQVADNAAQEHDVGAGSDRRVHVGNGGRARKARINDDQPCFVVRLGLSDPFETAGVRLGRIPAHDEYDVGIFDVDPVIRHRSTAKRRGKTCHRRAVSHTRLVIERQYA